MQRLSLIKLFWAGQEFLRSKEVPEGMPAILAHIPLRGVARVSAFFEETLGMAITQTRRAGASDKERINQKVLDQLGLDRLHLLSMLRKQ